MTPARIELDQASENIREAPRASMGSEGNRDSAYAFTATYYRASIRLIRAEKARFNNSVATRKAPTTASRNAK